MPLRSLFFALLAIACARAPSGVSPSAPGAAEATPATSARQTLALDPSEITWDAASNVAIFEPDRGVQRAAYETWRLDLASLERALGGRPTAPVSVLVEVDSTEVRSVVPSDPTLPAPSGGFQITTRVARVVGRAP